MMSKKKNKKFKKIHSGGKISSGSTSISRASLDEASLNIESGIIESGDREPVRLDPYEELDQKYIGVRREVKKILAIMGFLALLLVGTYFLQIKTGTLNSVSDYLYKAANIQTQ